MLHHLRIGQRLTFGFGLLLALCCALSGVAALQMSHLAEGAHQFTEDLIPSYEAEHEIAVDLGNIRRFEYRHILSSSTTEMDTLEGRIAESRRQVQANLDHYARDLISDEKERQLLDTTRAALTRYYAV
jgi:methyl-accepting chemotaxis protein